MAALGRLLRPPTTLSTSRRLYSVFSSKPGGGRYFNSAKPHKVVATNHSSKRSVDDTSAPSTANTSSTGTEDGKILSSSQTTEDIQSPAGKTAAPSSSSSPSNTPPPSEYSTPLVPFHPSFTAQTYPLHQFFSIHRPLLNLSLPTSALFDSPQPSGSYNESTFPGSDAESALASVEQQLQSQVDGYSADADADAARQLARALAINRLGGAVNWDETLAQLGDKESILAQDRLGERVSMTSGTEWTEEQLSLDSTKRKRRKKMSKHKYKKRRRLQRAERRKMGK